MHDIGTERLSEYLDGEMEHADRQALEAHLRECAECAAILADLEKVRARARDLNDAPLPSEIWPSIERAIRAPRVTKLGLPPRARFNFTLPELLAACLVVAIVSGGGVFALLRHRAEPATPRAARMTQAPVERRTPVPETTESPSPTLADRSSESPSVDAMPAERTEAAPAVAGPLAETPHEEAISELRRALASKRTRLDPATIRTLETNLAIIDLAIDQAKRALVADSANTYVKEHLADTMRRKVELLQRATVLASTSSLEGSR